MVVRLIAARPRYKDPELSITISVKRISIEQYRELLIQAAETSAAGIGTHRGLGLELEKGISDLQDVLESVVGVIIDKIDVLAEVYPTVKRSSRFSYNKLTNSIISSTLTLT